VKVVVNNLFLRQPSDDEQTLLTKVANEGPLHRLTVQEKTLLWRYREWCRQHLHSKAIVKILQCVNWGKVTQVRKAYDLLEKWAAVDPVDALELLDAKFANRRVRQFALKSLDKLNDCELRSYLLQLVQVLKYEPKHFSLLACWLIQRALFNSLDIGQAFFWHLMAELHVPEISERYGIYLEFFLRCCSPQQRSELAHQVALQKDLKRVAGLIHQTPSSRRKQRLHAELTQLEWPANDNGPIQITLDPTREVRSLIVDKCKSMDSAKAPLWLVFKNQDPPGEDIFVMFKSGDDLRQDQLTLQMLKIMDRIWKRAGLDLALTPYGCIATGDELGFIEIVLDSRTTADIQKSAGGVAGAFKQTPLANWLKENNPTPESYELAVDNFIRSCAGYCVATYVLGIGDRHNDNIMVNKNGLLFHIDFGHFLGNVKTFMMVKRERAPFILTPEFVYVMGGEKDPRFKRFVDLACKGYNLLRRHATIFMNLFTMMLSTGIPELKDESDIEYIRDAFSPGLNDFDAATFFTKLIYDSLNTRSTQLNFFAHLIVHA